MGGIGISKANAQDFPFSADHKAFDIPISDFLAKTVRHDGDYKYINNGDTINISDFACRSERLKKAAKHLRENQIPIQRDTIDINDPTTNMQQAAYFYMNLDNPESAKIILNFYLFNSENKRKLDNINRELDDNELSESRRDSLSIDKQFLETQIQLFEIKQMLQELNRMIHYGSGDKEYQEYISILHEQKHAQNILAILENISSLTAEELFVLEILDEVSAKMITKIVHNKKLSKKNVTDYIRSFVSMINGSDHKGDAKQNARAILSRYTYKKPKDNSIFLSVIDSMFTYEINGKTINLIKKDKFLKGEIIQTVKNGITDFGKIVEELSQMEQKDPFTKSYIQHGQEGFDKDIESWIEIAKSRNANY